jgi:glycosyltransferase involved in cell wall biosynthesis
MLRLAYFSPLPPSSSGIADYSHELLPHLARHAEIDLFVDDQHSPPKDLSNLFSVRSLKEFGSARQARNYDAAVYQIGNDPRFHGYIYDTLLKHPGIVVLHEYMLHHLVRGATLGRGDPQAYIREMRYCYGRSGEHLARLQVDIGRELDVWSYPLFERIVDSSLGVIVHSEHARERVLRSRPLARIAKINLHYVPVGSPDCGQDAADCRAVLGLPQDAFIVASFGLITRQKRVGVCIRAFSRLRRLLPSALLLLVGDVSPHYDLQSVLEGGLGEGVIVTRRVSMKAFLRYMAAADLAVNLRYPTAGETSAAVIRLLGMGKPVIVSNVGSFADYPDDCCAKVDVDDTEGDMLYEMMRTLATDEGLRRQMGANARHHIETHHTVEASAQGYIGFIQQVLASPLPTPAAAELPAPGVRADIVSQLLGDLSSELADLGIRETDDEILRELAAAMVDLNLDLPGEPAESGSDRRD